MADEAPQPWFVKRTRALVHAALYDEAAAQRWFALSLYLVGDLFASGGVIPGFTESIPLDWVPAWILAKGGLLKAGAIWLGAGAMLPSSLRKTDPPLPKV